MNNNNNSNNPLLSGRWADEGIKIISQCPVCRTSYNPLESAVIDEADSYHLLYIKCRRCHASVLALVMTNVFGLSSLGLVTDLDKHEVLRLKEAESISADEVLDFHEALKRRTISELLAI